MHTKLAHLVSLILFFALVASPALGVVLVEDDFESGVLDPNVWQLVNGPDVAITPVDGQVFFDRPTAQLNYLITAEQFDPAVTPLTITGSAVTGPEGLAIWTRAGAIGNTGGGPGHVLDSGIRIPLWPEGEASAWYDAEIIRKDPGVWGWTGIAAENIPGAKAYDWDFVVTDDGATIAATFTQSSDPNNTFTITAKSMAQYETNHVAFTVINGYLNEVTITTPDTVPFSLQAAGDIELGNDPQVGPDGNSNGSGLGARDIPDRRRVVLLSYDISELKGRDLVANVSLNNFSHDQHGEVNVYGVIEDLDLLDVESLTWNTAPGVMNDPTPELNSPVALDPNDLTDVLLTFGGPGQTGVRFSTDASAALAEFINSDTDGVITLLIAPAAEGNQLIVRARTHSAGGSLLEGNVGPKANIIWVSFHGADDMPSAGAAGAGFAEAPDKPYTDLLAADGYSVTRYITTNAPDAAVLDAADLVIVSRSVASSGYQNDGATAWNNISAPMIITGGYVLRSSRMGFTTGTDMPDTTGDITLTVSDPNHPIFAGISLTDGTMDNPFAGVVLYPDEATLARGISINNNPVNADGTVLAAVSEASAATGPAGGMVIGEWQAGAVMTHAGGAGTDILAGHRLVFLTGSREASGISSETAGLYDLYEDGAQMFLNAVAYMVQEAPAVEEDSPEEPITE